MTKRASLFGLLLTALVSAGCSSGAPTAEGAVSRGPAAVNTARLIAADAEPGEWMSHGRTYGEQRFSPLDQINTANVGKLGLSWFADLDSRRGQEATPIVADGVLYVSTAWSRVKAYDAATGKLLWAYDPEVPGEWAVNACCDVVNRGVAVWEGKVFVGSFDGRLIALDAATGRELWDVNTDTFVPAGRMRSVRSRHTATRLADGRVLVIGGRDEHERPVAEAEIWDPKTRTWRAAGRLKQARCCQTSTLLGDGRVLVVGGLVRGECLFDDDKPPCYRTTDSVELWDPKNVTFTAGPPLGEDHARAAHTATLLRDGRVLIAGGASNDDGRGDPVTHDAIWEPASSSWHVLEASAFRVYHSATLLEDGSVLFIGGQRDQCGCCAKPHGSGEFASTIVRYDPATDRWIWEGNSLVPRDRHGAALLPDGSVLVIGGQSEDWYHTGVPFGSTERWVSATHCRSTAARSP